VSEVAVGIVRDDAVVPAGQAVSKRMRDHRARREQRHRQQPDALRTLHRRHDRTRTRGAVALVGVVVALVVVPGAQANGDPASHFLLAQDVFFPFEQKLSDSVKSDLVTVVQSANGAGYPVKAAIINTPSDLGLIAELFGKPQEYAEFLGSELGFLYRGHLLIAMPDGLGLSHRGGKPDPQRTLVGGMTVPEGADGTGEAAIRAVARVATAAGRPVAVPDGSGGGVPVVLVVVGVLTVLVVVAAGALVVVARRRTATAS
jgi:hypothetical protein